MKRLLIFILGLYSFSLSAQTEDNRLWLSIDLTNNKFDYRFYESIFDFGNLDNWGMRVGVEAYLNPSLDLEGGIAYGNLRHENIFVGKVGDVTSRLVYKLDNGKIFKEDSKIAPYVFAGLGFSWFDDTTGDLYNSEFQDGWFAMIPLGGGLKVKATEDFEINFRASYNRSIVDSPNYMQYSVGVSFAIGKKKDSDQDGVFDKDDNCPNEVGPVENNGCPWPDSDNDGVYDKDDECDTTPGPVENNGCPWPDTDGDGVLDKDDACPQVAGLAQFNGCPDSDGDGVIDSEDNCPNTAGAVNGCPDSDGDGVLDKDDTCPQTAGIAANNGCPEIKEEVQKALELALKNIPFNIGSDVIRATSYASLNQVADLMSENTNFNLKMSGYTDNTGRAESNLELSKRRASAVRQYLIDKGVSGSRLMADGYGIANPVADNSTRAGRAANRRVELEIVFN